MAVHTCMWQLIRQVPSTLGRLDIQLNTKQLTWSCPCTATACHGLWRLLAGLQFNSSYCSLLSGRARPWILDTTLYSTIQCDTVCTVCYCALLLLYYCISHCYIHLSHYPTTISLLSHYYLTTLFYPLTLLAHYLSISYS